MCVRSTAHVLRKGRRTNSQDAVGHGQNERRGLERELVEILLGELGHLEMSVRGLIQINSSDDVVC